MLTSNDTETLTCELPPPPRSVGDLGIALNNLIGLVLKTMYMQGQETPSQLSEALKLNTAVINTLLEEIKERSLVQNLGLAGGSQHSEFRFALTAKGREWAVEALGLSQYVGPAPVSLEDYHRQVARQRLRLESVGREKLVQKFEGLIVPEKLVRRLGPAINSERSILLYGPPGNGKTTIGEAMASTFEQYVHIPYCIDVDGTIIKVFDPTLHHPVEDAHPALAASKDLSLRVEGTDRRWVTCKRPTIITGGELTLEMLDLSFNPYARYYEAPLHFKAIGGTFIVDDLGRQLVRPEDLLNRWIVPMEKRVDYLTLNTGKTFSIPFDVLLVFSTNLLPENIMDPAFLRRIPYKVELKAPNLDEYRALFALLSQQYSVQLPSDLAEFVARELQATYEQPLSYYQPKFIMDQCIAACKYMDRPVEVAPDLVVDAMENLSAKSESARGGNGSTPATGGRISRPSDDRIATAQASPLSYQ